MQNNTLLPKILLALPVALSLFFFGLILPSRELVLGCKALPALLLAAAVYFGMARNGYGQRMALALVFCAVGDLALELGETGFLVGMGAFLIGHFLFILALAQRERGFYLPVLLLFAVWTALLGVFLLDHLGEMLLPVTVYTTVITCLLWRSGAYFLATNGQNLSAIWAFLGAVSFAFSDSLIAINKFYHAGQIPLVEYPIMFFYWAALGCFTFSAFEDAKPQHSR